MMVGWAILLSLKGLGSAILNLSSGLLGGVVVWILTTDREERNARLKNKRLRDLLVTDIKNILDLAPKLIESYIRLEDFLEKNPSDGFKDDTYNLLNIGIYESISLSELREVVGEEQFLNLVTFYLEVKHCNQNIPIRIMDQYIELHVKALLTVKEKKKEIEIFKRVIDTAKENSRLCRISINETLIPSGKKLLEHLTHGQKQPSIRDKTRSFFG